MSDDKTVSIRLDKGGYILHLTEPEERTCAGISGEVNLALDEAVNLNQLVYSTFQAPIEKENPIVIPEGEYTLKVEVTIIERKAAIDLNPDAQIPLDFDGEEPKTTQFEEEMERIDNVRETWDAPESPPEDTPLLDLVTQAEAPTIRKPVHNKGKGMKTMAPRASGGSPPKPVRAKRMR